jgi:diamine N-acetyltransferase
MGRGRVRAVTERNFILVGERAALGILRREHLPDLATWFNDPEVRRGLAHRGLVNVEAEEKWFEAMTEAGGAPRPTAIAFAVHSALEGELVGACSLEEIDHNFLRADFGIFLGRRRREGIGSDAVRLTLDWAFHILGLRNVMLETYDFNEGAVRAYERAGFRVIGPRRDAVLALGARRDSILMDAAITDFDSPVLARLRLAE